MKTKFKENILSNQKNTKDEVTLYGTFRVGNASGKDYVSLLKGGKVVEIRDMNYVGSAVMSLISTSDDDTLYSKIK